MKPPFLPYGRQVIDDEDIAAVTAVLRSDWLTTGPAVQRFEQDICDFTGARHAVAVSNGTAALHAALCALDIGPGDEVIVPPMTFAATANAVLYCGGRPVFADVSPQTLLIDPARVAEAVTPRTKALIGVDYAGQPCPWKALRTLAQQHNITLVADACHSLGAVYDQRPVGTLADITCFSFHPVKNMTTGEGGMAVTDNAAWAERMCHVRGHGITSTAHERELQGGWYYEMQSLGYNYRITDIQCALGSSQLKKLPQWLEQRRRLASLYHAGLKGSDVRPVQQEELCQSAWHLYVVRHPQRDAAFRHLRTQGIGTNVHYLPVHLHPYYQKHLGTHAGLCPVAEAAYAEILTLPLWAGMEERDVQRVLQALSTL